MNIYVLSQILVILAYILCGIGFLKKEKIEIMLFSTLFSLLILIQYFLLHAYSGIFVCIINIIRNLILSINIKQNKKNSNIELVLLCLATIIFTCFIYKTPIDLFPIILALVGIFSYWSSSTKVLRLCNIVCSLCYIIYAIPIKSFLTIICEFYLIITTFFGFIKYEFKKRTNI